MKNMERGQGKNEEKKDTASPTFYSRFGVIIQFGSLIWKNKMGIIIIAAEANGRICLTPSEINATLFHVTDQNFFVFLFLPRTESLLLAK